jgi:archaellum biogenesis ATPase FlaH
VTNKTTVATTDRQHTDDGMTALKTSLPSAKYFIFLQSHPTYINQLVSKHLTQAKISIINIKMNRMDGQLKQNVGKYAGERKVTPPEIMERVDP